VVVVVDPTEVVEAEVSGERAGFSSQALPSEQPSPHTA
jgi:hypothetical protein